MLKVEAVIRQGRVPFYLKTGSKKIWLNNKMALDLAKQQF